MAPYIHGTPHRQLFDRFASGVAYITVTNKDGDENIGTCFHIGDNVYITARHIVEDSEITKVSTTNTGIRREGNELIASYIGREATKIFPPVFTVILSMM